jgi:hypothetical protein
MPKIAIIGPNFFSYMHSIRDEFKKKGFSCDYYDERHSNSIQTKIYYRLNINFLINRQKARHLQEIKESLVKSSITDVLLIDVEVVDKQFVLALKKLGINVHLYMWDSAKNKNSFTCFLDDVTSKSTFDMADSKSLAMSYIPLFAEDEFSSNIKPSSSKRNIDVSFCGTLHSDRARHLKKLKDYSYSHNISLKLMCFYHSKILYCIKSLFSFSSLSFLFDLSTAGFSKADVSESMKRSRFVFDMQHSGQGGLTARTFEALRSGACLLTFNENVLSLPVEFHERILVIKSIDDLDRINIIDYCNFDKLDSNQDYYLSLTRFVDELTLNMGLS